MNPRRERGAVRGRRQGVGIVAGGYDCIPRVVFGFAILVIIAKVTVAREGVRGRAGSCPNRNAAAFVASRLA